MSNKIITQEEYEELIFNLIDEVDYLFATGASGKKIVGLSRGGLIPAVYLSHHYQTPMKVIDVASYEDNKSGEVKFYNYHGIDGDEDILLIDDIIATGKTLYTVTNKLKEENPERKVYIGTLFNTTGASSNGYWPSNAQSISWAEEVKAGTWVQFPYESAG